MGLQIILPTSLRSVRYRCRVPTGHGDEVCNKPFFEGEHRAYQQHVIECCNAHEDAIRTATVAGKMPGLFGPESGDAEFKRWVHRHRQAIIEGRKKM